MIGWVALFVIGATVPAGPPDDPRANGYLGVLISQKEQLGVDKVLPGTPADRAGLRPGDVVYKAGELIPKNSDELIDHIMSFRPGTALRFELRRPGAPNTPPTTVVVTVRLIARPLEATRIFPPE